MARERVEDSRACEHYRRIGAPPTLETPPSSPLLVLSQFLLSATLLSATPSSATLLPSAFVARQVVERIVNRGEKYTMLVIDEHYGPGKRFGSTAIEELHDYWTAKGETPPILISCRFAHPEASP